MELTLYHSALSTCSRKVRLVPTLVVDESIRESSIIAEYLDARVDASPLTPDDPPQAARMRIRERITAHDSDMEASR